MTCISVFKKTALLSRNLQQASNALILGGRVHHPEDCPRFAHEEDRIGQNSAAWVRVTAAVPAHRPETDRLGFLFRAGDGSIEVAWWLVRAALQVTIWTGISSYSLARAASAQQRRWDLQRPMQRRTSQLDDELPAARECQGEVQAVAGNENK